MFTLQVPLLEKVLRAALVYLLILVLVRVSGRRALAATNTMDFVVLFLLASGVENAILTEDNSVTGGAVSAVVLIGINACVRYLTSISPLASRILQGRPTTVIEDGHVSPRGLRKVGMRQSDLDHAVRSQNGDNIGEIEHGELTPSGQLVLTLEEAEQSATKGDVADLAQQLRRIEGFLVTAPTVAWAHDARTIHQGH
ncbi:DUF421 domain-containing protein [Modestobacter italicus]|nr:YetF domain-containing protein [Modestobacter marinus]